jgi:hypothetical protein
MWHDYGDLAARAQESWLTLAAGKNLLFQESLRLKAQELRTEVSGENPSPLERLLVERVVATWLQVSYADAVYALAGKPGGVASLLPELRRRQESAQRSHLAAVKQLAVIRKLLKPALSPFDILSRPTAETAAKTPPRKSRFKVRRGESVAVGATVEN